MTVASQKGNAPDMGTGDFQKEQHEKDQSTGNRGFNTQKRESGRGIEIGVSPEK